MTLTHIADDLDCLEHMLPHHRHQVSRQREPLHVRMKTGESTQRKYSCWHLLVSSSLGFPVNLGMCFIITLFSSLATPSFLVVSCYPECSDIYSPAWPLPLVQDIQTWYWQDNSWRGWADRPVFKVLAVPTLDPQCSPPRTKKERKKKNRNKTNKKTKQKTHRYGGMHLALWSQCWGGKRPGGLLGLEQVLVRDPVSRKKRWMAAQEWHPKCSSSVYVPTPHTHSHIAHTPAPIPAAHRAHTNRP